VKFYVNPLSVHPLNEVESLSRNLVELDESGCFGGNSLPHKLIMWKVEGGSSLGCCVMVLEMVTPFTCFPTPAPAACLAPEPIIIRLGKERHRLSLSLVAPIDGAHKSWVTNCIGDGERGKS
jgi:hypothetical protein